MTSQKTSSPPPPWFTQLIGEGLASLYLLSLDGCPAADSTSAVTGLWSRLVWEGAHRDWHEQADTPCIRRAFKSIATHSDRWPTPSKLIGALPERDKPTGNLLGEVDSARRRDALACEQRWRRDLGLDRAP
jgi:hypothetical protein